MQKRLPWILLACLGLLGIVVFLRFHRPHDSFDRSMTLGAGYLEKGDATNAITTSKPWPWSRKTLRRLNLANGYLLAESNRRRSHNASWRSAWTIITRPPTTSRAARALRLDRRRTRSPVFNNHKNRSCSHGAQFPAWPRAGAPITGDAIGFETVIQFERIMLRRIAAGPALSTRWARC